MQALTHKSCASLFLFGIFVATMSGLSTGAEESGDAAEWSLERDRDGIQIYTRPVDGSKFKAVRSVMLVESSVRELVALVMDASACSDWADLCKKAEVVETVSASEMYVYTFNDIPWPVSDRDAIAHVTWKQNPDTHAVTMKAVVSDHQGVPEQRGVIRLSQGETSWSFQPLQAGDNEGKVKVISFAHVDPGGATPAWLSNRLLVDSPFKTMQAMRNVVSTGQYADTQVTFLDAPVQEPTQ